MRAIPHSPVVPPLGPALRRATILLAPAALSFAVGSFVAGFVFADPAMERTAAVLAAGAAVFAFAWRLLQRGLVRPAALLLTVTLLVWSCLSLYRRQARGFVGLLACGYCFWQLLVIPGFVEALKRRGQQQRPDQAGSDDGGNSVQFGFLAARRYQ